MGGGRLDVSVFGIMHGVFWGSRWGSRLFKCGSVVLCAGKGALRRMIKEYTHEAGVRELERVIGKVHRKRATEVVQQKKVDASIKAAGLEDYLGVPKMRDDRLSQVHKPGVATGLAWTPVGGTVLFIEAAQMPGKGLTKVTGQLGEVMTEATRTGSEVVFLLEHSEAGILRNAMNSNVFLQRRQPAAGVLGGAPL